MFVPYLVKTRSFTILYEKNTVVYDARNRRPGYVISTKLSIFRNTSTFINPLLYLFLVLSQYRSYGILLLGSCSLLIIDDFLFRSWFVRLLSTKVEWSSRIFYITNCAEIWELHVHYDEKEVDHFLFTYSRCKICNRHMCIHQILIEKFDGVQDFLQDYQFY